MIISPAMKIPTELPLLAQKRHEEEVARVEENMRRLFYGNRIDSDVVHQYNVLERRWKKLTGYKP